MMTHTFIILAIAAKERKKMEREEQELTTCLFLHSVDAFFHIEPPKTTKTAVHISIQTIITLIKS